MEQDPQRKKLIILIAVLAVITTVLLCVAVLLGVQQIGNQTGTNTPTPTAPSSSMTPTPSNGVDSTDTATPTPTGTEVQVYFSKEPSSFDDTSIVVPVTRFAGEGNLNGFVLGEIVKGPTEAEKISGLFVPFKLTGTSTCDGKSYQFNISASKMKVKFCKDINAETEPDPAAGAGLRAISRVLSVLHKSLTINGVSQIEVRDKNDNCYGLDAGDLNSCI